MSAETTGTFTVKRGLADMLRGGVIMDVVNAEQAKIAEDAGAVAVMVVPLTTVTPVAKWPIAWRKSAAETPTMAGSVVVMVRSARGSAGGRR